MKYISILTFTFCLAFSVFGQGIDNVIEKGDAFEQEGNYSQAKYYYNLAYKVAAGKPHYSEKHQGIALMKIAKQDSLLAYKSSNIEVRRHMKRYDSLVKYSEAVWQIVELERVIEIDQNLVHPKLKVEQLWANNPGVTKQVRILQSKANRESFVTQFAAEKKKIAEGKKLEGYYGLKALSSDKHPNSELDTELAKWEKQLSVQIAEYEQYLKSGDSLFIDNKFLLAKDKFKKAISLNSECTICQGQMELMDAMIEMEPWTSVKYNEKLQEARSNASSGELLAAKREYQYILKNVPMDKIATDELLIVEEKLKSQQTEKRLKFGIKLQEERANTLYVKGDYAAALAIYKDLEDKYVAYVTDLILIENRIVSCEKELAK